MKENDSVGGADICGLILVIAVFWFICVWVFFGIRQGDRDAQRIDALETAAAQKVAP